MGDGKGDGKGDGMGDGMGDGIFKINKIRYDNNNSILINKK